MNRTVIAAALAAALILFCGCSARVPQYAPPARSAAVVEIEDPADNNGAEERSPAPTEPEAARPSVTGALSVTGADLTDKNGNPVQLKGISTHGLAWFPQYVNPECFYELSGKFNANVIRLALYTAESGGYCTDGNKEELKRLVREGVDYAEKADMYVIVDWHILSDGDPNIYKEEAKAFFDEMSEEFADKDHVLYEICNEPNGATDWTAIKSYAEEIIPVIRAHDPDAVILIGTPQWSQKPDAAIGDPITNFDNIMYTLHFYAATHKDDLRETLRKAHEAGLPVFVSEYGICGASGGGDIDYMQAAEWTDLMDELNISSALWNLSDKDETSAIINADCGKTYGFEQSDLSESGKWALSTLNSGSADEPEIHAEEPADTAQAAADGVSYELERVGSWRENGTVTAQYALTVKNDSDEDIEEWSVTIPFDGEFDLKDCWNGIFSAEEKRLAVKNAAYNGGIPAGDRVTDVGFIAGGAAPKV